MDTREEFRGSSRLHWYLFIFRFLALILGLFLTEVNRPDAVPHLFYLPGVSYDQGASQQPFLYATVFLFFYHFAAGAYSFKAHEKKLYAYMLIFADLFTGLVVNGCFGTEYFLLGFVLPAMEAAMLLGNAGFFFVVLLPGFLYAVMMAAEIMPLIMSQDDAKIHMKIILIAVLKCSIVAATMVLWVFKAAVSAEEEVYVVRRKAQEDKNIILEESQNDKKTIQGLSNQYVELTSQCEEVKRQLLETREELEKGYKNLHAQKQQYQASDELHKEKEREMTLMCEKRVKEVDKDIEMIKKKYNKVQALLDCFQELNKSLNPEEAYMSIVEHLLKMVPSQTCILFIVESIEGQPEIFAEVAYSPYSDFFRNFSLRLGEGVPGIVAEKQKPIKIDNGSIVIDGVELSTLLTYEKSAIVAPILYEEEILGVLYLGRPENFGFNLDNLDFLVSFANIAAITLQNAQLFQKTIAGGMYDDITGLYNAIYFNERFSEEVKRSHRYNATLSLMLVDIDNFTRINDEYGAEWGDNILKEVAEIIKAHTRETDVIARIQSDEFAVLLLQSDKSSAVLISERIRMAVEMRSIARQKKTKIHSSLSIGVANFPSDAQGKEDLISKVEEALQQAKKKGGNNTSYPPS
jgi:diguanylate cyclase (GGDEF)-like protein